MDEQCGLRHCWLRDNILGFGKLPAALTPAAAVAAPLAAALLTAVAAALTAAAALALTAAAVYAAVLAEFRVYSSLPVLALTAAAAAVREQWRRFRHHHRRGHQPRASWSGGASSLLEASKRWHCSGSTTSIPGCSHRQPGWRRPGAGWARNGESAANVLSCHRRLCAAHLHPLRPLRIPASPPLLRLLAASFLHRSRRARWLRVFGGRGGGSSRWRSVCPICSEWW